LLGPPIATNWASTPPTYTLRMRVGGITIMTHRKHV
jgi:hypothetical protein